MIRNSDMNSFISRKRIRENLNWTQNTKRWNVVAPLQVLFCWLLAKGKIRYVIGFYTLLLTLSLHYGAQNVRNTVSGFYRKAQLKASPDPAKPQFLPNIAYWSMPDAAKQTLEEMFLQIEWNNKDSVIDTKNFIEEAKDILTPYVSGDRDLLWKLRQLISDVGASSPSIDALVFENLPQDPYVPNTPTDESVRSLNKPTFISEAMLMAMGEIAGTYTVGYKAETEYSNPWAHEGFPRQGPGGSALTSTAGMLSHHQDMSYQRVIPDLLGLICLREGDDANLRTTLISIENIIQLLPKHVESILREDRFNVINPAVGLGRTDEDAIPTRPLLEGTSLHLPVRWENMVGIDLEASQAIESLRQVLQIAKPSGVHLHDGEMVLFNNKKVVHGRTPYQNLKYDGRSDRVVIRSYFVKELSDSEMESRII